MYVELVVPGVIIDERKRREPLVRPFVEGKEELALLSVVNVIAVSGREELRGRST